MITAKVHERQSGSDNHSLPAPYWKFFRFTTVIGEAALEKANSREARCVLLPTVPFGRDHSRINSQVVTIIMRATVLQELSKASLGDCPFVIEKPRHGTEARPD